MGTEAISVLPPVFYYNVFYYMADSVWFLIDICCLNGWVNGWVDGWMDAGWMVEWMYELSG